MTQEYPACRTCLMHCTYPDTEDRSGMTPWIPRTSLMSGDHLQSTTQSSWASGKAERRAGTTGRVCTRSPRELSRTARSRFGREVNTLVLALGLRRLRVAQEMLDGCGEPVS